MGEGSGLAMGGMFTSASHEMAGRVSTNSEASGFGAALPCTSQQRSDDNKSFHMFTWDLD